MAFIGLKIKSKILQHLLFWVALFFIYILSYGGADEYYINHIKNISLKFPFYIIGAYTFNNWQVPKFLNNRKITFFTLSILLVSFLLYVGFTYGLTLIYSFKSTRLTIPSYFSKTLMIYTPALLLFAYQTQQKSQKEKNHLLKVQQEKIETELKYLKAQLNPHFLFNTLNNLYSFVVTQSPKAPDMVLQLSEMLDYVLYKSQANVVFITEEIKCIENYIALEKTRYGDRLQVSIEKPETLNEVNISPLILLSIVENAFKHGASRNISQPEIKILIQQEQNTLIFNVWNTKDFQFEGEINDSYKEGIGLGNIKRQLNLIYPENHILKIENNNDSFNLNLIITNT